MPYMYSEMQNKLSKTRDSPLESMGQIISSRCPRGRRKKFLQQTISDLEFYGYLLYKFEMPYAIMWVQKLFASIIQRNYLLKAICYT